MNCWEFKKCGREAGGARVGEMGVCPASTVSEVDGIHGGKNGGRCCWAVVGTFCGGVVQDSLAMKLHHCVGCEFRNIVHADLGDRLLSPAAIGARLIDAATA